MKKLLIIFSACFLIFSPGAARADDQTPEAFVNDIYAHYTGAPENATGIFLDSDEAIHRYFDSSLASLIIKDDDAAKQRDEVPLLDGDPFVDSQEWDIKSFDIKVEHDGPEKASAAVAFTSYGEKKSLKLFLVHLPEGWRIDDILWSGDEGTFRGLYAANPQ